MNKLTTSEISEFRSALKLNDIKKFASYLEISEYDAFQYVYGTLNNCEDIDDKLRILVAKNICGRLK